MYSYAKISKRDNKALDYAVSKDNKLLLAGYELGMVKAFLMDSSKKYVAELKGHQAACLSLLIPHNAQHILYSAASDNTIRVWNLHYF